jgi:site-specific DNA-methyltransferase (adenine-specific)
MNEISNTTEPQIAYSECCTLPFVSLYNEDCIETMKRIPDGSIDLMLTDPPYNTTACEWEYAINFEMLWAEWLRIVKPNGAFIFTASQPFTTDLIMSNRKHFKYELIWDKVIGNNPYAAKYQPMRIHENICIFYREQPTYNPIKQKRELKNQRPNSRGEKANVKEYYNTSYGNRKNGYAKDYDDTTINPKTIIEFMKHPNSIGLHPTQKSTDLMRYLILTYTNKGETVFDGYSGSGTTAEACMIEQRNFIGSELNKEYFDKSVLRLKNVPQSLF